MPRTRGERREARRTNARKMQVHGQSLWRVYRDAIAKRIRRVAK
jgi:hypothetical protein